MGVRPAIAIHETYRTYDRRKFGRKFTTYMQLSYGESEIDFTTLSLK